MLTKSNVSGFTLIPVLFVLTLFLLLSSLAVSVIMAGGSVYEDISDNMQSNYDRRVAFSYLATKIRQSDSSGNISVAENMITIGETQSGEYVTHIYYYDGYLRRVSLKTDASGKTQDFELYSGEEIIQAESFSWQPGDYSNEIVINIAQIDESLYADEINGITVLAKTEIITSVYVDEETEDLIEEDEEVFAYVYYYDGYLMKSENVSGEFIPENGIKLIQATDFSVDLENGLVTITVEAEVNEKDGQELITVRETQSGEYVTYIYYYDGYIRELLLSATDPIDPDAGNKIVQVKDIKFYEAENGGIKMTLTDRDDNEQSMIVSLRSQRQDGRDLNE